MSEKQLEDTKMKEEAVGVKPEEGKEAEGKATEEKSAQEKAAEEKSAQEKATKEKPTEEKSAKEKPIEEKTAQEKTTEEKAAQKEAKKSAKKSKKKLEEKVGNQEKENAPKKKGKAKRIVLTAVLVLATLAAGGYVGIAMYYQTHFLPNTSINGIDCGNMDAAAVAPLLEAKISEYSLVVRGRDYATGKSGAVLGTILPEDIGLAYVNSYGDAEYLLAEQNQWAWIQAYMGTAASHSLIQGITFDEDMLGATVRSWAACQKKNMIMPEDAHVSDYNDAIKGYEVIPETSGTELDMDKVFTCIVNELHVHETSLDLEEMNCYTEAAVKSTDTRLTDAVDTANSWLGTKITYDWNNNEVILDGEILKDWIRMEQGTPVLDEDAVADFVKKQAAEYDTYGKRKNFTTTHGVVLTLNSRNYGWKTDAEMEAEELTQLIYQGSVAEREPAYSIRARAKGMNDVGNSYIEADLTHQHLYVYQDGEVAFETDFVSGKMNSTPDCVTPAGIFGLTYKTTNAVLRGADYETPVNYWMPFYGNYGMHDATWRVNFGGTIYQAYGSHGCINLPLNSAATIYEYVSTGFPVVCYYYDVDPLEPPTETEVLTEEELQSQEEPTLNQNQEQNQEQGQNQEQEQNQV